MADPLKSVATLSLQQLARHSSVQVLSTHVRNAELFEEHVARDGP
jgi:hypothetical protein